MALENKATKPCEGLTPKAKYSQMVKNATQKQNSPSPLKFRSFEAFYKHYSQKQSHDQVSHLKSPQMCKYKVTVVDKNESGKGIATVDIANDMESLIIRTSDRHRDLDSNKNTQPYRQPVLESEYFKGRVKRICQIFQKAHDDSNYREALQQAILKKKRSKVTSARRTNTHLAEKNPTPRVFIPSEGTRSERPRPSTPPGHRKTKSIASAPGNIPSRKDYTPRSKPSIQPPSTLGSTITNVKPLKLEESALNPAVLFDDHPEQLDKLTWLKHGTPSPKAASPVKHITAFPLGNDIPASVKNLAEDPTESNIPEDEDSHETEQSVDEILVEDILNRFLTDPTFGENFINLLDGITSFSDSDIHHISQILNDIDFLVESDDSNPNSPCRVDEESSQTAFGWFFNKPQVFDINLTDRTGTETPEGLEQIPEDLRINNANQFGWINEM